LKNDEIKVLFKELNERKNHPLTMAITHGWSLAVFFVFWENNKKGTWRLATSHSQGR
jgi:hypothetical protein